MTDMPFSHGDEYGGFEALGGSTPELRREEAEERMAVLLERLEEAIVAPTEPLERIESLASELRLVARAAMRHVE